MVLLDSSLEYGLAVVPKILLTASSRSIVLPVVLPVVIAVVLAVVALVVYFRKGLHTRESHAFEDPEKMGGHSRVR